MIRQFNLTKQDGSNVLSDMVAFGDIWNVRFLSRNSQVSNLLEEYLDPSNITRYIDGDEVVVSFIDAVLQYIQQTNMYNENTLGVDGGFTIKDAVVTAKHSPDDIKSKLKFTKALTGHILDMSDWVIEMVSGQLPFGLSLKYFRN